MNSKDDVEYQEVIFIYYNISLKFLSFFSVFLFKCFDELKALVQYHIETSEHASNDTVLNTLAIKAKKLS